jgi:hypothetical protein
MAKPMLCGVLIRPGDGPWTCTLARGHSGDHQNGETIEEYQCGVDTGRYVCELPKGHPGGHNTLAAFNWIKEHEEKLVFQSGASSSKIPRYDLIPAQALRRIADRFELGLKKYKEASWNARSKQDALQDKEWVIARASHVIDHAYKLIEKMIGAVPDDGDDDAAAIVWGGICLIQATEKKEYDVFVYEIRKTDTKELTGWLVQFKEQTTTCQYVLGEKQQLLDHMILEKRAGKRVNDFVLQ